MISFFSYGQIFKNWIHFDIPKTSDLAFTVAGARKQKLPFSRKWGREAGGTQRRRMPGGSRGRRSKAGDRGDGDRLWWPLGMLRQRLEV